jgi:retron-type reverse transcriptase
LKTYKRIYPQIVSWANVQAAWLDARKGKRRRPDVAEYELAAEDRVRRLALRLQRGQWEPGPYRVHIRREPKPRLIAVAPFESRVVHHAIHRVLAPLLGRRFVAESYACLPGKGTHRAVLAFQQLTRAHAWVARLDVRRYFLEIQWDILLKVLRRSIGDERALALLSKVIESGAGLYAAPEVLSALGMSAAYTPQPRKGLPIGNLTSQLFANLYLDGLDHFCKRQLKVPGYLRYMDDIALFGDQRGEVRQWVRQVRQWLAEERGLEVHPCDALSTRQDFRYLGYVVSRSERRIAGRTVRRLVAKVRARLRAGMPTWQSEALQVEVGATVKSWLL